MYKYVSYKMAWALFTLGLAYSLALMSDNCTTYKGDYCTAYKRAVYKRHVSLQSAECAIEAIAAAHKHLLSKRLQFLSSHK